MTLTAECPQWFECALPLDDWASAYTAAYPLTHLEAQHAAFMQQHAAQQARIAALEAETARRVAAVKGGKP